MPAEFSDLSTTRWIAEARMDAAVELCRHLVLHTEHEDLLALGNDVMETGRFDARELRKITEAILDRAAREIEENDSRFIQLLTKPFLLSDRIRLETGWTTLVRDALLHALGLPPDRADAARKRLENLLESLEEESDALFTSDPDASPYTRDFEVLVAAAESRSDLMLLDFRLDWLAIRPDEAADPRTREILEVLRREQQPKLDQLRGILHRQILMRQHSSPASFGDADPGRSSDSVPPHARRPAHPAREERPETVNIRSDLLVTGGTAVAVFLFLRALLRILKSRSHPPGGKENA